MSSDDQAFLLAAARRRRSAAAPAFSPDNISGLRWWLRADSATLSGSNVESIDDRSGNGHVLAPVGAPRATYVASAAAFGNRPVFRFAETAYYEKVGGISLPYGNSARTVFTAASQRVVPDGGPNPFFMYSANDAAGHIYQRIQATGAYRVFAENAFTTTATGLVTAGVAAIWGFTFSSGSLVLYKDGTSLQTFSVTLFLSGTSPRLRVGTSDLGTPSALLDGDIAEILLYDSLLSTENRQAVETYLKSRYSIP